MISVEGAIAVGFVLGLLAAIQLWQDHQLHREQEEERRKAALPSAE